MEIDRKSIGTLIKELTTVTVLCFMAQERIKAAQTTEEKAAAGDDAQSLNAKINQYIRALDQRLGESEITPASKTYGESLQYNAMQALAWSYAVEEDLRIFPTDDHRTAGWSWKRPFDNQPFSEQFSNVNEALEWLADKAIKKAQLDAESSTMG